MSGNWFTDRLPWRFVVIRKNYFRNAKIASVAPEIRGEINRNAFLVMASFWLYVPLAIVVVPIWVLHFLCELLFELKLGRLLPDIEGMRIQSVIEASAKVSPEELRRRLGNEPSHILSKKP